MVGRFSEVCRVVARLVDPECRLVTLFGYHGVGKGSVAKKAAFHLSERKVFEDGIIYISIKGLQQPLSEILYREVVTQLSL